MSARDPDLHAIGQQALSEHSIAVLSPADQVRGVPGEVIFATGLVLLAAGLWRTRSRIARPPGPAPVRVVETASGSVR